jgi:hypothetical protein
LPFFIQISEKELKAEEKLIFEITYTGTNESNLCVSHENDSEIIDIKIKTPFEEKSLQAVDFVSWAIFRKYEYRDDNYYKIRYLMAWQYPAYESANDGISSSKQV